MKGDNNKNKMPGPPASALNQGNNNNDATKVIPKGLVKNIADTLENKLNSISREVKRNDNRSNAKRLEAIPEESGDIEISLTQEEKAKVATFLLKIGEELDYIQNGLGISFKAQSSSILRAEERELENVKIIIDNTIQNTLNKFDKLTLTEDQKIQAKGILDPVQNFIRQKEFSIEGLKELGGSAPNNLTAAMGKSIENTVNNIEENMQLTQEEKQEFVGLFSRIADYFNSFKQGLGNAWKLAADKISSNRQTNFTDIIDVTNEGVEGTTKAINENKSLTNDQKSHASSVLNRLRRYMGIESISVNFSLATPKLGNSRRDRIIGKMVQNVTDFFNSLTTRNQEAEAKEIEEQQQKRLSESIIDFFDTIGSKGKTFTREAVDGVIKAFEGVPSQIQSSGQSAKGSFQKGLQSLQKLAPKAPELQTIIPSITNSMKFFTEAYNKERDEKRDKKIEESANRTIPATPKTKTKPEVKVDSANKASIFQPEPNPDLNALAKKADQEQQQSQTITTNTKTKPEVKVDSANKASITQPELNLDLDPEKKVVKSFMYNLQSEINQKIEGVAKANSSSNSTVVSDTQGQQTTKTETQEEVEVKPLSSDQNINAPNAENKNTPPKEKKPNRFGGNSNAIYFDSVSKDESLEAARKINEQQDKLEASKSDVETKLREEVQKLKEQLKQINDQQPQQQTQTQIQPQQQQPQQTTRNLGSLNLDEINDDKLLKGMRPREKDYDYRDRYFEGKIHRMEDKLRDMEDQRNNPAPQEPEKKGMSNGMKAGLAVAFMLLFLINPGLALVVVGGLGAAYGVYKTAELVADKGVKAYNSSKSPKNQVENLSQTPQLQQQQQPQQSQSQVPTPPNTPVVNNGKSNGQGIT